MTMPALKPSLFATCLVDALVPQVGAAALKVLGRLGMQPETPRAQVCCGQSLFKAGQVRASQRVARAWVEAFRGSQVIISPSGSCVAHVRQHLPGLLQPWPGLAAEAADLAARTFELSQYLHRVLGEDRAPWVLLDGLAGGGRVDLPDAEVCCGFGGPFAVSHPELSARLMADKLAAARATGAETLVVGDVGCFVHLTAGARQADEGFRVFHLAQALAGEMDT